MTKLAKKLRGKFIVIDGPDGTGKTTQVRMLSEYLRSQEVEVTETRDPGGTEIGDRIRKILLDNQHTAMTIGCEILLYMASRTQLMGQVIHPAIEANRCVLCDRWVSSTIAYQVAEGTVTAKEVLDIYEVALRDIWPDLTVILDLPVRNGLARIKRRLDRVEAKSIEFHKKVRELFLQQVQLAPKIFTVVDAAGTTEQVQQRLRNLLDSWKFTN